MQICDGQSHLVKNFNKILSYSVCVTVDVVSIGDWIYLLATYAEDSEI
jgi:hypothetical protein